MKPPKGYYRELLKNDCSSVRIAFTHTPIIGCKRIDSGPILKVLDRSDDPYARFYADGLRNGTLATIVENGVDKIYRNNGELYFTT